MTLTLTLSEPVRGHLPLHGHVGGVAGVRGRGGRGQGALLGLLLLTEEEHVVWKRTHDFRFLEAVFALQQICSIPKMANIASV